MDAKKEIVGGIILFILIVSCNTYTQRENEYCVNDVNVGLREKPSLDSAVIKYLKKNEIVWYDGKNKINSGGKFNWLFVSSGKEKGWVYGQYITKKSRLGFFTTIEDVAIITKNGLVLCGMEKEEIVIMLGDPEKMNYDEEYAEYSYVYNNGQLIFLIYDFNGRVHQIILKNREYKLGNGIGVGSNIKEAKNIENAEENNNERIVYLLKNVLRPDYYNTFISMQKNEKGVIEEIQIGLLE